MTNIMNIMDQRIAVIEGAMETLEKALINKDVLVEATETSERDQEPFEYFCAYKLSFDADDSVITYDKLPVCSAGRVSWNRHHKWKTHQWYQWNLQGRLLSQCKLTQATPM